MTDMAMQIFFRAVRELLEKPGGSSLRKTARGFRPR